MSTRCKACDVELFGEYLDDELCATCMGIALDLVPDEEVEELNLFDLEMIEW